METVQEDTDLRLRQRFTSLAQALTALLAAVCTLLAPLAARGQSSAAVPAPTYMIDANTLGFGGSNFKAAPDAAAYIAAEHLRWGWAIGSTVTYCPATVPAFSNADFTAATPPSTTSA